MLYLGCLYGGQLTHTECTWNTNTLTPDLVAGTPTT